MIENSPPDERIAASAMKTASQWTMFKEIIGTFIGIMPFVVGIVIWGSNLQERTKVNEVDIAHLKEADKRHDEEQKTQRQEVIQKLDRIAIQIESLQMSVARASK
jgi:hypothetical protein